jgi:hypothetical protein
MGTGMSNTLMARFRLGKEDYYEGSHPLWEFSRAIYQMKFNPVILGGIFILFGYIAAFLQRMARPISSELIKFYRNEQMQRLKGKLSNLLGKA